MNTEERLNKIKHVAEEIYKDVELRSQGMAVVRQTYIDHISTYKERIKDLLTVAKTLYDYIGERVVQGFSPYSGLGFIIETNLWGDTPTTIKIGYYDGHDGITLLSIDENCEVKYSARMGDYSRYKWDRDFERLEAKVYNYVDNEL